MTEITNGIYEDSSGNLVDINGKVLVPVSKRVKAEVYSRVVGYMRPVSGWNKGKKQEFKDRTVFVAPTIEGAEPREERDA